jgi:phosphate transport system permease protein
VMLARSDILRDAGAARWSEWLIEQGLRAATAVSLLVTVGIVAVLCVESMAFFRDVSPLAFLFGTSWTPLFYTRQFGVLPLVAGTLLVTTIALVVALPAGLLSAIYLSEYAAPGVRRVVKPLLELLAGVPTVVFGYFALLFVTPLLQQVIPGLPGFNLLGPGIVIGIMIVPYISSLSEDAMRAVPMHLREASYGMGASRVQTAVRVVLPAALSGVIASYILAVSRAVGETMVVAIAAGQQPNLTFDPTESAATITAFIVQVAMGDLPHGSIGYQTIFAAGLSLMLITLVFNIGGHMLRRRFREAY